MANRRLKRLMQESLDEQIAVEERRELYSHLDADYADADEYRRLRQVDSLLRSTTLERAPASLAMSIMAKIAEGLQQPNLSRLSGLALALALSLVTLALLPVLAGMGWLLLNAIGSASALTALTQGILDLVALVVAGFEGVVQQAQLLLAAYPYLPALILTLIPASWFWAARVRNLRQSGTV